MITRMKGQVNLIYLVGMGISLTVAAVGWGFAWGSPSKVEINQVVKDEKTVEISVAVLQANYITLQKSIDDVNRKLDLIVKAK